MKQITFATFRMLLLFLMLTGAGCASWVRYKHGIKEPKTETPQSMANFLRANHFPTTRHYLCNDSASWLSLLNDPLFRQNLLGHLIFNRHGSLLIPDSTKCQWAGAELIRRLHPDSAYGTTDRLSAGKVLGRITPAVWADPQDSIGGDADFTVIVTWACFLGQYNYRLFDLENAVRQNTTAKLRLIWLNVDMQKSWNLAPAQRISFK